MNKDTKDTKSKFVLMPSKPAKAWVTETGFSRASNISIFNRELGLFVYLFILFLLLLSAKLDVSSFARPSAI